jgi:hypothetical protein
MALAGYDNLAIAQSCLDLFQLFIRQLLILFNH